jgi:hypothetical protein
MHFMRTGTVVILALGLAVPAVAVAQQRPQAADPSVDTRLDVSRLPVNLQRIHRQLQQSSTVREERDGLNLRYQIEVFGRAPEIKLFFPEDNLTTGPVPYGAPTHAEIIRHITPKEFSSPVMDFSALARWLAQKAGK